MLISDTPVEAGGGIRPATGARFRVTLASTTPGPRLPIT